MAVPLIITVSPAEGHSGGGALVDLQTNFARLPPAPPVSGYVGGPEPISVSVLFGTTEAERVQVLTAGRVLCTAPRHAPGVVDITIRNLDATGAVIPGETFTLANAYTFRRPDLTAESKLTRITRELRRWLSDQVLENTVMTTHTDYDSDTEDMLSTVDLASLPALVVQGPTLTEDKFRSHVEQGLELTDGVLRVKRSAYTVDLRFDIVGITESQVQLLNLMSALVKFFNRNRCITMLCDPNDPSKGSSGWDMDFLENGGEPKALGGSSNSNLRSFSAISVIAGFPMDAFDDIAGDGIVDIAHQITQVSVDIDGTFEAPLATDSTLEYPFDHDILPPALQDAGPFSIDVAENTISENE